MKQLKILSVILFASGSVGLWGCGAKAETTSAVISGTPRLIRSQPETEIFFRDLNTSYIIPKDDGHNKTYEAVEKAMKSKSKVSLRVDPQSRRVLGVADGNSTSPAAPLTSAPDVEAPASRTEEGKK